MKRDIKRIQSCLFIIILCFVGGNLLAAEKKPDVLFIAVDDMNDWTTLFNKNNPIKTPNLERLAERGCFFTRAYCTTAVCNPSRTAILTGLRPTTSGVYDNKVAWAQKMPDAVTMPLCFRQNGYDSIGGGKIFHHGWTGTDRKDVPSFDRFFKLVLHADDPKQNHNGYTREQHKKLSTIPYDWGQHDVPKQTDEYTVEFINNVMAEHPKDKPLFLAAGIFRPHLPFWAPTSTFNRYPLESLQMPQMPEDDLNDIPQAGLDFIKGQHFIYEKTMEQKPGDPGSLKKMVQSYQASADFSDEMVGRLLDQLEATGRADNTIIVLWSDHGYHLGDKTHCVKHTLWEKANHVPFIIVAPGVVKPGSRCERPVSLVDIYPTLVELTGINCSVKLDGQSLVPLLKDPNMKWERPALMTYLKGNNAIKTQTHRYIRYADGSEELYADSDGWNITNLAKKPEMEQVLAEHRKLMDKALAE